MSATILAVDLGKFNGAMEHGLSVRPLGVPHGGARVADSDFLVSDNQTLAGATNQQGNLSVDSE
jgi:hypothetical protein